MGKLDIRKDDLRGPEIANLLKEHLDNMHAITPAESVHALDLSALRDSGITFWAAWEGAELLGCGALKAMDDPCGEIKSMRTAEAHRGRGIASKLLQQIIEEAQQRGYQKLFLETGSMVEFAPARALYERFGFDYQGPFADYKADPNSVFMSKRL